MSLGLLWSLGATITKPSWVINISIYIPIIWQWLSINANSMYSNISASCEIGSIKPESGHKLLITTWWTTAEHIGERGEQRKLSSISQGKQKFQGREYHVVKFRHYITQSQTRWVRIHVLRIGRAFSNIPDGLGEVWVTRWSYSYSVYHLKYIKKIELLDKMSWSC